MKLSDIMSQMGLSSYAEIGLLLFFLTFVAIAIYVYRTPRKHADECSQIPLRDTPVHPRDSKSAPPPPPKQPPRDDESAPRTSET